MYYVYEFYIVDTGEIIYAGKGKGRRYKVTSQRNELLTKMLAENNCKSRIVKTFDKEEDAFTFEFEYINQLRAQGQCICNIHSGGAGGSGEYWTEELRREYSERNVMKSPDQRARMSANNPMKDPKITKKVSEQKRKPVLIGDKEYSSVKEAQQAYGVAIDTIIRWCKKGVNSQGEKCRYKNEEQVVFSGTRYNKGSCRSLTYKGKHYESPLDLAKELGCSASRIYSWTRRGFSPDGIPCRYDDDTRELGYENRLPNLNHELFCQRVAEIDPSIEVIGLFKNTSSKIQCRCKECGTEWLPTGNNILQNRSHCPNCSKTRAARRTRTPTEDFLKKVAEVNKDVEVLGQFKGTKSRIECKCKKCGNTWSPIAGSLLTGRGCRKCAYIRAGEKNSKANKEKK